MKDCKLCYVYLPVYNGKKFIDETLNCVLNQDYLNFKIIITDDCSTDDTFNVLENYKLKFPDKIILLKNKENMGVGYTLHNTSVKYSDASYVAQVGQDDLWPSNYLSSQIANIEKTDSIVSFAKVDYVNDEGAVFTPEQEIFHHEWIDSCTKDDLFLNILKKNFLCAPASVINLDNIKKEMFASYWGYNNDRLQDCEMWLNLSLIGKCSYNKSVKMKYRLHNSNMSDESKRIMQGRLEYYTMVQRVLFSEQYDYFVKNSVKDKVKFIESTLDILAYNIPYSPFLKMVIIEMTEKYLNLGFESKIIKNYLFSLYQDSGLITKCLKQGRNLAGKLEIILAGSIKQKDIVRQLESNENFIVRKNIAESSVKSLILVDESGMEYLLNDDRYYYFYEHGQIIVLAEDSHIDEMYEKYRNLLIIDSSNVTGDFIKKIYEYVEDRTALYRTGFLDLDQYKNCFSDSYEKVLISNSDEKIRYIEMLDSPSTDLEIIYGNENLEKIGTDGNQLIFKDNKINEDFIVYRKDGIRIDERIVINNKLYRCIDIILMDHELIPRFQVISYNNFVSKKAYANYKEMLAHIDSLQREIERIQNSYRYKVGDLIANGAEKLNIKKLGKKILRK